MKTTIPFTGFYGSIHDHQIVDQIDVEVEYLRDYLSLSEAQIEDWEYNISYRQIFEAYTREYTETLAPLLKLETLQFEELVSPREYNFETDRIFCDISEADVLYMYNRHINTQSFQKLIQDQFAPRSGFMPFYSNDIQDWKDKPLQEWDHNEIGMLIQNQFNSMDMDDLQVIDEMRPVNEIVDLFLPYQPQPKGEVNS